MCCRGDGGTWCPAAQHLGWQSSCRGAGGTSCPTSQPQGWQSSDCCLGDGGTWCLTTQPQGWQPMLPGRREHFAQHGHIDFRVTMGRSETHQNVLLTGLQATLCTPRRSEAQFGAMMATVPDDGARRRTRTRWAHLVWPLQPWSWSKRILRESSGVHGRSSRATSCTMSASEAQFGAMRASVPS